MSKFSNVLRLITAVSNFSDSSLGMTKEELEKYFRKVFTDEKTYGEFYHQGCLEMNEELFNYTKMCCDVDGFSEDEENYIYGHIIKVSNPYLSVSDNYHNLYVEIFHDASGYLGQSLTDAEFEEFRGFVDEDVPVWRQIQIMVGKNLGKPFEENNDLLTEYAIGKSVSTAIFYRGRENKKETAKVNNTEVSVVNCKPTQICDIRVERDVTDLVYAIINTSNYDGDMGTIIVKCCTPVALQDYGFTYAECVGISTLQVGELFTSHDYGSGCVVVRMS